jgi:cyclophilin family peptidyl-prolyl cis-trans isomerase
MRLFILLVACTSSSTPAPQPDLSQLADLAPAYQIPAGYSLTPFLSDAPVLSFPSPGPATQAGKDYRAVVETDVGTLVIDLTEADTPITVNSFVWLALHHFFDGIAFHRVISNFVAQGGDPNTLTDDRASWGTGDPGYGFGLEIVPSLTYDGAGVVGMARSSDPNSNGSQFFITLAATHNLDGMYTIFGHVTDGLDVLPKIARGEPPATPTRMQRVYIVEK